MTYLEEIEILIVHEDEDVEDEFEYYIQMKMLEDNQKNVLYPTLFRFNLAIRMWFSYLSQFE
jgi:hypothetical protein